MRYAARCRQDNVAAIRGTCRPSDADCRSVDKSFPTLGPTVAPPRTSVADCRTRPWTLTQHASPQRENLMKMLHAGRTLPHS
jgi:hypothetical protein